MTWFDVFIIIFIIILAYLFIQLVMESSKLNKNIENFKKVSDDFEKSMEKNNKTKRY